MDKEKYNGWYNQATWRVNLEWFDGNNEWLEEYLSGSVLDVAEIIQSYVRDAIDEQTPVEFKTGINTLANCYAHAFLDDVNWFEIAEHLKESHEEG
jgi:hypothetical protein